MKESMDLRRCGSSGGVGDKAEFCAKDKVAYAKVAAASSKILATLTKPPPPCRKQNLGQHKKTLPGDKWFIRFGK